MEIIKIFIDSNVLDRIVELESFGYKFEYYYPNVDPYQIKKNHLPKNKLPDKTFLFYQESVNAFKKAAKVIRDKSRVFIVQRPDQTEMIQSFDHIGPISHGSGFKFFRDKSKANEVLRRIRKIIPNLSETNKDIYVLLTIIMCNGRKDWVAQYDWESDKNIYNFITKCSVYNSDGKKYFITQDKRGLFSKNNVQRIELEFPDLKIFNLEKLKKILK